MFEQVLAAAGRLRGVAHETPTLRFSTLGAAQGLEPWLKCENLQRAGAFKFRGAYNALASVPDESRRRGVFSFSSGNHAQALALAGRLQQVGVTVVMPADAPRVKRDATLAYGATIVEYDPQTQDREQVARALPGFAPELLIPPFDHPDIIAGQGTAALELLRQAPRLDCLVVPCGGGGLLAGCAIVTRHLNPACRIYGVEPEGANDAQRSFDSGRLQRVERPQTLADGLRTPSLGALNFDVIREQVDGILTVNENEIIDAVRLLATRARLVVEPSGAVAAAALLRHRPQLSGRVGVIISGGNIDPLTLARILEQSEAGCLQ